jgi:hypothetical protein
VNEAQIVAFLDQEDAEVVSCIKKYGVYIQYVGGRACSCCQGEPDDDDGPPFAYTVGLFGLGHPELVIVGAGMHTSAGVLNELSDRVQAGGSLLPGELITFEQWPHRIVPEPVPNPGEILYAANRHYQRPAEVSVPALQLSYDDTSGRFPWEDGYEAPDMQPRPGAWRA